MAIRIKARNGESVEQLMRRFKKLCEKEGLTKDIKRKEFFDLTSGDNLQLMRNTIAYIIPAPATAAPLGLPMVGAARRRR